jgi:hypothetical protein
MGATEESQVNSELEGRIELGREAKARPGWSFDGDTAWHSNGRGTVSVKVREARFAVQQLSPSAGSERRYRTAGDALDRAERILDQKE